ncbi:MAG: YlcI/YnfO family protein [Moorellaceae bacterium]
MAETKMLHIRFPSKIVDQLTAYLANRGINRNRFIVDAVAEKLRRELQAEAFKETQGVLSPEDVPEWAANPASEWVEKIRGKDREISSWDI